MNKFEESLNNILVDTFNFILKYEEMSLQKFLHVPVTITEAHMIDAMAKEEKTTVSKLASLLEIAIPTATVAAKKMEKKGFIQKTPCEKDARRTILSLTETGQKIARGHRLFHEKMVRHISRQFEETEKDVLLRAVNTLSEFFKAKVEI